MDCRYVMIGKCAGYEFEYWEYITISTSAWDKKIHHYGFCGNSLIIHGIKTPEKLCVSIGHYWENLAPFGFEKKQKIDRFYVWKEKGRELKPWESDLARKYYRWVKDSKLWLYQSYYFMMYFNCNDLIIIFCEIESNTYEMRLENIKEAFHVLRMDERKELEGEADE